MRILVTGGRDFSDHNLLYETLDNLGITEICQGGAKGADRLAGAWAHDRSIPCVIYKADWGLHGKSAGIKRNIFMLDDFKPDLVVAFPGGRGTAHMIQYSKKQGYKVEQV